MKPSGVICSRLDPFGAAWGPTGESGIGGPPDPIHDEIVKHVLCLGGPRIPDKLIVGPLGTTHDDKARHACVAPLRVVFLVEGTSSGV